MSDKILESLFLDHQLWVDAVAHGVSKGMPLAVLESFQNPHFRATLCRQIAFGKYDIEIPHTAYIPKNDGGERIIFVNNHQDRLLLHVIYKWLTRHTPDMIHQSCQSYQEGVGIGKIVKDFSKRICQNGNESPGAVVGRKFDIHKYFDSVNRSRIHQAFDLVEQQWGRSSVINLLRRYYNSDLYYDSRLKKTVAKYNGLKQGCAISSWLANVILFPLDEAVSKHEGLYVRYSDDIVYVGRDFEEITSLITHHLSEVGLTLNGKKTEPITPHHFVRFLGYNIKGDEISLSAKWVKTFQHEINRRTVKNISLINKVRRIRKQGGPEMEKRLSRVLHRAQRSIALYLYYGDGHFSWASHVLGIVNRKEDLKQMNLYCIDALRAVYTGKTGIGALGVSKAMGILRSKGRHVAHNRQATAFLHNDAFHDGWLNGYLSMLALHNIKNNKWVYRTLTADLIRKQPSQSYPSNVNAMSNDAIEEMEKRYDILKMSQPDGDLCGKYYALTLEQMTTIDLLRGSNRSEASEQLEQWISDEINFHLLKKAPDHWYWQSDKHPELVLLEKWFN